VPTSNLALAPAVLHYCWEIVNEEAHPLPARVLDVGVGTGKYGVLLREYCRHDLGVDGVEPEARYLDLYPWLDTLYGCVYRVPVEALPLTVLAAYDLLLMVDVLEHLDPIEGRAILDAIPCPVVVCTPREAFQNPECIDYPTEAHRSCWSPAAFGATGRLERWDEDAWSAHGAVIVRLCAAGGGAWTGVSLPGGPMPDPIEVPA